MIDDRHNWAWTAHLDPLVQEVLDLLGQRGGRLAALCVTAPPEASARAVQRAVGTRLEEGGLDDVELQVVVQPGPMRIVSAEFDR